MEGRNASPVDERARRRPRRRRPVVLAVVVGALAVIALAALPLRPTPGPIGAASPSPDASIDPAPQSAPPASEPAASSPTPPAVTPRPTIGRTEPYILMPRDELLALPTSGPAWDYLVDRATSSFGRARLCDQGTKHGVGALAAALVHARTGEPEMRTRVREAIAAAMDSLPTGDCRDGALAVGRQLGSYALAADLVGLDGSEDEAFRAFLRDALTRDLGDHTRWFTVVGTHEDSTNNWGAFAGASRIAVGLYLDDDADVAAAADVLRGFLGDRAAYDGFRGQVDDSLFDEEKVWACDAARDEFVPVNSDCRRDGIDLDGAIVGDIWRDGDGLRWPLPEGSTGMSYTFESLQGLALQVELLAQNGYPDAWSWSGGAMGRMVELVNRNAAAGGQGWNMSSVSLHVPWLLNARLGTSIPTEPAGYGRIFGFTDWLYPDGAG